MLLSWTQNKFYVIQTYFLFWHYTYTNCILQFQHFRRKKNNRHIWAVSAMNKAFSSNEWISPEQTVLLSSVWASVFVKAELKYHLLCKHIWHSASHHHEHHHVTLIPEQLTMVWHEYNINWLVTIWEKLTVLPSFEPYVNGTIMFCLPKYHHN